MRKFAALLLICFATSFAGAQIPGGNVFFGYSYSGGDVHSPGSLPVSHSANLNGWEGSLEGKFLPWIGIVGDLSGHYGASTLPLCRGTGCTAALVSVSARRYAVLFGPRVSVSVGKFTPFAHAMVGAGHVSDSGGGLSNSDTSLATAIGGGLDYKLIKGVAWRFQGDELHMRFFGTTQDHFRFSTGLVLRF